MGPRWHHPPQLRRLQLRSNPIEGIAGVVEQGDVEIRASPEAPQNRALRGDQVSGPGVLLAHGPFQLWLHERPGKRGDQPWYDVFEIRIAPDILRTVEAGISQSGNRPTLDNPACCAIPGPLNVLWTATEGLKALAERTELEHDLWRQERWTVGMEETGLEEMQVWCFGERIVLRLDNPRDHRNAQARGSIDHQTSAVAVQRLSREGHPSATRRNHVLQDDGHTRRGIRVAHLVPIGYGPFRPPRSPAGPNVGPEFLIRYLQKTLVHAGIGGRSMVFRHRGRAHGPAVWRRRHGCQSGTHICLKCRRE